MKSSSNEAPENEPVSTESKLSDPTYQRERLFEQDPRLIEAISYFATKIRSCPADPKYPDKEPMALLVGGFVRDSLLRKKPKDADVEVYGISTERLESLLDQLFEGKVNKVGKSFGIFKIDIGDGFDFDVSIPRRESKSAPGHKGFIVEGDPAMTSEEAARRRDFTMNSISADILTGQVLDPYGGLDDLENKILRVTDPERFQDDPLRVYRAMQFVGRMNLGVEDQSLQLMREMVLRGDLDELSKERITEEFKKLFLKGERPSNGLELLQTLGVIERYYPELKALADTPQEPEWHPEGNVWIHSLMALDVAAKLVQEKERELSEEERLEVMIGTLCHDLGKPGTTSLAGGKIKSLGHEEAGIEPTETFLARFMFGEHAVESAKTIAAHHLKPNMLYRSREKGEMNETQYANAVRKLLKRIAPTSAKVLVAVSESDSRGRAFPDALIKQYETGKLFTETIAKFNLDVESKKPLISGKDILEAAKRLEIVVKPGPLFGKIIKMIEDSRDNGTIGTKEEAVLELENAIKNLPKT